MLKRFFSRIVDVLPRPLSGFINQTGFQRYFVNTSWVFFGQLFFSAMAFLVGTWVARYLGPEQFGAFSYAVSFCALFSFLAGFGVDSILTRELVRRPERTDDLLGAAFYIKLFGGLLAVLVINLVSSEVHHDSLTRLLVFVYSISYALQSFAVISSYFQARVISKKTIQVQIGVSLISVAVKAVLIYFHASVVWFVGTYIVDAVTLAIGLIWIYVRARTHQSRIRLHWPLVIELARNSLPLMCTIIAVAVYSKVDQVIIRQLLGQAAVGIYAVAVRMTEVWYLVPSIIGASLFPAIINARKVSIELFNQRMHRLYFFIFWLGVAIVLGGLLLGRPIIYLLFGTQYQDSISIFYLYLCSLIPSFIMSICNYYLIAENYTREYLLVTCVGAILNVVLNLFLIPRFYTMGAAAATVISYSFVPLSLWLFPRTREQFYIICKAIITVPHEQKS